MGCSVSRHMIMVEVVGSHPVRTVEIESSLSLDVSPSSNKNSSSRKANGCQPVSKQPSAKRVRNCNVPPESRSEKNTVSHRSAVIERLQPEQTQKQERQAAEEDEVRQAQELNLRKAEMEENLMPLPSEKGSASTTSSSSSGQQSLVCVPLHTTTTPTTTFPPTTWTKMSCCGMQCQNPNSRFCCEHNNNNDDSDDDEYATVSQYCPTCRERYQHWQEANQAFEDILCELEQQQKQQPHHQQSTRTPALASSDLLAEEEEEEVSEAGSTGLWGGISDDDHDEDTRSGEDIIHHHVTRSGREDPDAPSTPIDGASVDNDDIINDQSTGSHHHQQQQFNPETQTGRYEVMCNSPSTTKDRVVTKGSSSRFYSSTTSSSLSWRPATATATATRYLYLLRNNPICLSSLSLGEHSSESVTGSMHSF